MTTCRNCTNNFDTKYCPNCGTPASIKRIDKKYVMHEIRHGILHLESGFLFTTKQLLINPGHSIRKFINGDRIKHYKPIAYLIICSIVYSFLSHYLDTITTFHKQNGYVTDLLIWITDHYNYSNIIETVFIALTLQWFFKKDNYNYFENFVLISYLTGFVMLIGSICLIIAYFSKIESINKLSLS